jgi:hypothetical protein
MRSDCRQEEHIARPPVWLGLKGSITCCQFLSLVGKGNFFSRAASEDSHNPFHSALQEKNARNFFFFARRTG